jgi:hypothetical protein
MPWTIVATVSPSKIRVDMEYPGGRTSIEERPHVALQFDARQRRIVVLAIGKEVDDLPARIRAIDRTTTSPRDASSRTVDPSRVESWKSQLTPTSMRTESLDADSHDAEIVAIDPHWRRLSPRHRGRPRAAQVVTPG